MKCVEHKMECVEHKMKCVDHKMECEGRGMSFNEFTMCCFTRDFLPAMDERTESFSVKSTMSHEEGSYRSN
jgi:hypothetical protein